MDWVVFLFGSGIVFFLGVLLILGSMATFALTRNKWLTSIATLLANIALLLIAASATPMPLSLFFAGVVLTILWLVAERSSAPRLSARRKLLRILVAAVWFISAALEFSFQRTPTMPAGARQETLYIIADSVTAGIGDGKGGTWPHLVADRYSVKVVDLAQPGATVKSALRQAEQLPSSGGLLLLEIGGNDLLGTTSSAQYEKDLHQLLTRVCVPHRDVVMLELPLPPLCGEYGRIQRRLAARFKVTLVPKRFFVSVLTGPNATLDSIHLSSAGHQRMAGVIGQLLYPE